MNAGTHETRLSGAMLYLHAISTRISVQTDLDQVVVLGKVGGVKHIGLEVVVD